MRPLSLCSHLLLWSLPSLDSLSRFQPVLTVSLANRAPQPALAHAVLRSAALEGLEARRIIGPGQGCRKLGSMSYSPEGPTESWGLGLWEGESGFSEAMQSRVHAEPLWVDSASRLTAACSGRATLLCGHRRFHRFGPSSCWPT